MNQRLDSFDGVTTPPWPTRNDSFTETFDAISRPNSNQHQALILNSSNRRHVGTNQRDIQKGRPNRRDTHRSEMHVHSIAAASWLAAERTKS